MKSGFMRELKFDLWMLGIQCLLVLLVAVVASLVFSFSLMNKAIGCFSYPVSAFLLIGTMSGIQRFGYLQYNVGYSISRRNLFYSGLAVNSIFAVAGGALICLYGTVLYSFKILDFKLNYFVLVAFACFLCSACNFMGAILGTKTKKSSSLYIILFMIFMIFPVSSFYLMDAPIQIIQDYCNIILHSNITALVCLGLSAIINIINWRMLIRNEVYG
jgi:hypothetical protein